MNFPKFNLRFALSTSTLVLLSVISVTYFYLLLFAIEDIAKNNLRQRLKTAVNLAEEVIDVESHRSLKIREDENSESFKKIVQSLRIIRNNIDGIKFIYTTRLINGKIIYIVDCEEKESDRSKLGEEYDDASDGLKKMFNLKSGDVYYEKDYTTDKYGTFFSAYNPIFKDGVIQFVIGSDITLQEAGEFITKYKIKFSLVFICLFIVITPLVIWFTTLIRTPLYKVRDEILKLKNLDIDNDIEFKSSIVEVNDMIDATAKVKVGLRSFRKYVPSTVVKELVSGGEVAEIGGRKEIVTVLFSDIDGFTHISENNDTTTVVTSLNEYFDIYVDCLEESGATVDKFIGDSVMAFWNAPVKIENHESVAIKTAIKIYNKIELLNQKWKSEGKPFIFKTRMGINSGEVIIGNIGASNRMNYTITGDTVNLASRLEVTNKIYKTNILVSESVYGKSCNDVDYTFVVDVKIRGKHKPVKIYTPTEIKYKT